MTIPCVKLPFALLNQLRIVAEDGGTPPCSRTSLASITVNRNLQAPQFLQSEYAAEILETFPLTQSILSVSARDGDDRVGRRIKFQLNTVRTG